MNRNQKKELVPILALLVFIVVVLILCAVSAGRERRETAQDGQTGQEMVSAESGNGTEGADGETNSMQEQLAQKESGGAGSLSDREEMIPAEEPKEAAGAGSQAGENGAQVSGENREDMLEPSGKGEAHAPEASRIQDQTGAAGPESAAQTSGNGVKKTNEEMLSEMADYWSRENVAAVEDLGRLSHYRRMSASLQGPAYFYYYGDRNGENRPDGTGIAVYGGDQYYYGGWADGKRSGQGMWLKLYFPDEKAVSAESVAFTAEPSTAESATDSADSAADSALRVHSYRGGWADNLPNGEGHEQYVIDMDLAKEGKRYFQNVIGGFQDGLYEGSMYIITVEAGGNTREWDASASKGVFETFPGRDQEGRVPMGRDRKDADSHMWIWPLDNREQGIREVRGQEIGRAHV